MGCSMNAFFKECGYGTLLNDSLKSLIYNFFGMIVTNLSYFVIKFSITCYLSFVFYRNYWLCIHTQFHNGLKINFPYLKKFRALFYLNKGTFVKKNFMQKLGWGCDLVTLVHMAWGIRTRQKGEVKKA